MGQCGSHVVYWYSYLVLGGLTYGVLIHSFKSYDVFWVWLIIFTSTIPIRNLISFYGSYVSCEWSVAVEIRN